MEPVGLAVGVVGLAGLFSTCIDCFHLVQRGRYLGRDYLFLETKYTNQRLRLFAWGRACGFVDGDGSDTQIDPWSDEVRWAVSETLRRIATLLQDHRTLSKRYGLSSAESSRGRSVASSMLGALAPRLSLQASPWVSLASPVRYAQKRSAIPSAARWAIGDKQKFEELVLCLKDFIDDLESFTANYKVPHRQRQFIQAEVESICDVSELEIIEQARIGGSNPVADAAGLRLSQLQRVSSSSSTRPVETTGTAVEISANTLFHDWELVPEAADVLDSPIEVYRQVLHRVSCDLQPTAIFLDVPSYDPDTGTGSQWLFVDAERCPGGLAPLHLSGRRPLHNLGPYLEQNTQLWWLVFKEYTCCHDSHKAREAKPSNTSIRLVSQALCDELNSKYWLIEPPNFTSGTELRQPYAWFYHNRHNVSISPFDSFQGSPRDSGPATESQSVADTLLTFIQALMNEDYQLVSSYVSSSVDQPIAWELLPLIFEPGNLVVERCPDGEDDFRAFVQAGIARLVHTSVPEPQEVLEFSVQRHYDELLSPKTRTFQIQRSVFENGQRSLSSLSVVPLRFMSDCNDRYLYSRGKMFDDLKEPTLVTYTDELCYDNTGEYLVDITMYRRLKDSADLSVITPRVGIPKGSKHTYQPDVEDSNLFGCPDDYDSDRHNEYSDQDIMCMPHSVWGFHLRDHVWRRLLVRNIEIASTEHFGFQGVHSQGDSKGQLSELLTSMKRDKWSGEPYLEHQRRIIVAFQGPGRELAATVASKMTKRALYHIRLVGSDISPDAVLQQAKTLNEEWGCIILIEDIVEAMQEGAALKRHDVLQPLLRFLDGFMGITIFLLPDEPAFPGRLHPLVALHVCMNLVFIPGHPDEGFDEDHRRDFWQRLISERSMCFKPNDGTFPNDRIIIKQITVCSEKEDRESRERVASLAAWDLTEYEIRLIVDAALPRSRPADVKPDWELIDQLVKHRRLPQTEKEVIVKNDTRHTRAPSSSRR